MPSPQPNTSSGHSLMCSLADREINGHLAPIIGNCLRACSVCGGVEHSAVSVQFLQFLHGRYIRLIVNDNL